MSWVYIPDQRDDPDDTALYGERAPANDDWRTRNPITLIVTTPGPVLIGGALFLLMLLGGLGFVIGYWSH